MTREPGDLDLRCTCGALGGVVHGILPSRGNRVVCYCGDCQSFAHFLGRPHEILDPRGGTDIFQTSAARLELTRGRERLACMRLTPKGLVRWYAACCNTPIGNTLMTPAVPFVGLIHLCLDARAAGSSRDEVLGPVRGLVNTRSARVDAQGRGLPASGVFRSILRFSSLILRARLRGDHRRSAFFDARTGQPIAAPRVLSDAELREVERRRDAT